MPLILLIALMPRERVADAKSAPPRAALPPAEAPPPLAAYAMRQRRCRLMRRFTLYAICAAMMPRMRYCAADVVMAHAAQRREYAARRRDICCAATLRYARGDYAALRHTHALMLMRAICYAAFAFTPYAARRRRHY